MNNNGKDWENSGEPRMKEKPFAEGRFTPEMRQAVMRATDPQTKESAGRRKRRVFVRTAAAAAGVLLLAGGVLFGYVYRDGIMSPPSAPTEAALPSPLPATSAGPEQSDEVPPEAGPSLAFPAAGGGTVSLPLAVTEAVPAIDDGETVWPGSPEQALDGLVPMTFELEPEAAEQLQATLVYRPDGIPGYLLLSPAGWIPSASIGANGSFGVEFLDPEQPGTSVAFIDNAWSCPGCAIGNIGSYFPERAEWADSQGFTVYDPLAFAYRETLGDEGPAARTAFYRLEQGLDGYVREGAVYYEEGESGYLFRQLEFRLPSGAAAVDQNVMEAMKHYFAAYRGALAVSPTGDDSGDGEEGPMGTGTETGQPDGSSSASGPESTSDGDKERAERLEQLYAALGVAGMKLGAPGPDDDPLFRKELAGVWPDEQLIDPSDSPARPERLSVYAFDSEDKAAEGLEILKLQLNRTTFDGGAFIYPHVFRGAGYLVVYWTGGDSETPFVYDKTIKNVLKALAEVQE